ncbi:MAG: RsmD family RNA methyltransferase, partial [Salinibacterium sp.]|nr:RsmD family RNA methyltransferase [Salinibacterium sp.]
MPKPLANVAAVRAPSTPPSFWSSGDATFRGYLCIVTRIIAGFAGSLSLAVPGAGTRPTSDRVREAIFSALESRNALQDARVVDLFAGSGA